MLNMIVVQFPRAMNSFAVLVELLPAQRWPVLFRPVWRYRHDVRGAVGKPYARSGKRHLHHVARKIARLMCHVLVRRRYVAACGVVISAKVGREATPARSL